jgi:hypothetical protein
VTCDEVKVGNGATEQPCSQHHADEGNHIPYSFFGMTCDVEGSGELLHFHKSGHATLDKYSKDKNIDI